MANEIAITARDLGKVFRVYPDPRSRIVEWVTRGKVKRHTEKWALRSVSFDVPKGSALGVVGSNGAGKSTLLKIMSGTTLPTTGHFEVRGRLGSLLELGAGFHGDFSGKDNIFMNAAIMGIPKREVKERFSELAEFAELGDYLMMPVRTYSSGMTMRLGFATALLAHPDILILDGVLAVGDAYFQKKCMDRIRKIRESGTSVLFVSHSIYHIRHICDAAIWLHQGQQMDSGDPTKITDEYVNFTMAQSSGQASQAGATESHDLALPHLGPIKITRAGETTETLEFRSGEFADIHVSYVNPSGRGRHHVGVIVNRNDDLMIFSTRSSDHGCALQGKEASLVVRVPLSFTAGEFYISGYLLEESCDHILDQRLSWSRFKVNYTGMEKGVILADVKWLAPEAQPR